MNEINNKLTICYHFPVLFNVETVVYNNVYLRMSTKCMAESVEN